MDKSKRNYILLFSVVAAIAIISVGIKFIPEPTFSSAAVESLQKKGWTLNESKDFSELDEFEKTKWGGDEYIQSAHRWIFEKDENKSLSIRIREFRAEDTASFVFNVVKNSKDITNDPISRIEEFEFRDGALTALYLDYKNDALIAVILDGDSVIEVAYSDIKKIEYDTKNYYEDLPWIIKLAKGFWRVKLLK